MPDTFKAKEDLENEELGEGGALREMALSARNVVHISVQGAGERERETDHHCHKKIPILYNCVLVRLSCFSFPGLSELIFLSFLFVSLFFCGCY